MSRLILLGALLAACGSKSGNDGLPPATDWQTDDPAMGVPPPQGAAPKSSNPHEGVPGAPPIADEDDDPHRGVEGAPPLGNQGDEEAAVEDQAPQHIDVTSDQPIDPAHRVRGTLKLAKAVADRVKANGVIYLMAKLPGPDGKPTGSAMAVERTNWTSDGQTFELGGATGEVLVIARYDQDEDGMTAQPGDIIGMTKVKVPADNVVVELSTIVQ